MEARAHQGYVQDEGLHGDARRRRAPDQGDATGVPYARVLAGGVAAVDVQVGHDRGDRDHVVQDRGPHVGPEARPRVEHLPPQGVQAVEEDLRHAPEGEGEGEGLPAVQSRGVEHDDQRRRHRQHGGYRGHGDGGRCQQPVDELLPVALTQRLHDLRNEDRVEHAPDHQVVELGGQVVRDVEGLGGARRRRAQGGDQQRVAHQPQKAAGQRARRHHSTRTGDR